MRILILIIIIMVSVLAHAQDIRPVKDDIGYVWNLDSMKRLITYLSAHDQSSSPPSTIIAGITPHDDHLYAGAEYYPLYKNIKAKEAVIFGVTHKTVRDQIGDPQNVLILDEYKAWKGLKSDIPISDLRDYIKKNLNSSDFIVNNKAHAEEHSIEAQIPFLQYYNPEIHITPIMVTGMPIEKMEEISDHLAKIITAYMNKNNLQPGKDIVFLISADANHYGKDFNNTPFGEDENAHKTALNQDLGYIQNYLTGPMDSKKIHGLTGELWGATYRDYKNTYWCGKFSIPFGMLTTMKIIQILKEQQLQGKLLRFDDTYSGGVIPVTGIGSGITAPFSLKHWVSFFSAAYYAPKK